MRGVVAFNPYDYSTGVGRANRVASIYVGAARLPAIGAAVTRMENKPVLGIVLRGRPGRRKQAFQITTSPSFAGSAVVAGTRVSLARSFATWTA